MNQNEQISVHNFKWRKRQKIKWIDSSCYFAMWLKRCAFSKFGLYWTVSYHLDAIHFPNANLYIWSNHRISQNQRANFYFNNDRFIFNTNYHFDNHERQGNIKWTISAEIKKKPSYSQYSIEYLQKRMINTSL